ncbi:protein ABHD13 [Harmonia axyridis]|uniref:protein ABHD13 n=1 Tax=Harmonia axyridis TaxID=115357 RepID=UPI001E27743C|nr:protein ABHD13 [Harmonia axyridis]
MIQMGGYLQVTVIVAIILKMMLRVWAYSGLVLVFCFLLYYMYGGIFAFTLLFMSILGILYHAQDNFLFYPEVPSHSRVYIPIPSMFGLPYESLYTKASDGTLIHMYFIHQPIERRKNSPTILFFHGNAGNMGHRLQNCVGLYHNLHCNILLVEYRGYGLSEGSPTEEGLYLDAKASLEYILTRNDINNNEIIVFGRSLGGAVAIDLASRDDYSLKIWCVVVENTFTSIPDMARVIFGWKLFNLLPLVCYKNKFLSLNKMKLSRVPTLFISGLADTLVPPRMMNELHGSCNSYVKQLLQFPAGTHNETWTLQGYYHSLAMFLQNCRIKNPKSNKDVFMNYSEKKRDRIEIL